MTTSTPPPPAATAVPTLRFDPAFVTALVAVIGTRLSPYALLWEPVQVVEDEVATPGGYCAVLDAFDECLRGHFDLEHSTIQVEPASHSRAHPEVAGHA